ncbi:hypothetical protein ACCO45_009928 [Purpureocillium lilacinum]|uniref:Uncharacterized protein n=1 Tax=Purpureocillium lilacinum TaxID=33203 RepID=A0ACC4DGC3_PURLI
MGSPSGLAYAQVAKKQHTALLATKYACHTVQAQPSQPVPVIGTLVAADNSAQVTELPSHTDARGELRFDTPTGARQWRAKSDPIPSRIQCADTQEPRRTQMDNTKSAGKQINDHMTKTGAKQKCVTDPARIGLSEAPVPSVNIWLQRRDRQSTAAKPATATAEGAISVDMTFALTECFKDTMEPNLYHFRARNGEKQLRKTEKDAKAIRSERLFPIDGSSSWPTPMKKEKERLAGNFNPHDNTGPQAVTSQIKQRHKQKWVTYDYVPSVKFEIQIPPLCRSKPRRDAQSTSFASPSDGTSSRDRAETTSLLSARTRFLMDASNAKGQKRTQCKIPGAKIGDPASLHAARESAATDLRKGPFECRPYGYRSMRRGQSIDSVDSQLHYDSFASASGPNMKQECHHSPPDGRTPKYMFAPRANIRGKTQLKPGYYVTSQGSIMPFSPPLYWHNIILQQLKNQIEYYFSIENLCKDIYLRKRMDNQGFVDLHFVATFKRMRELTTDMDVIRAACEASTEVEYIVCENASERLRRRSHWQAFVLPREHDDELRPT